MKIEELVVDKPVALKSGNHAQTYCGRIKSWGEVKHKAPDGTEYVRVTVVQYGHASTWPSYRLK